MSPYGLTRQEPGKDSAGTMALLPSLRSIHRKSDVQLRALPQRYIDRFHFTRQQCLLSPFSLPRDASVLKACLSLLNS